MQTMHWMLISISNLFLRIFILSENISSPLICVSPQLTLREGLSKYLTYIVQKHYDFHWLVEKMPDPIGIFLHEEHSLGRACS